MVWGGVGAMPPEETTGTSDLETHTLAHTAGTEAPEFSGQAVGHGGCQD